MAARVRREGARYVRAEVPVPVRSFEEVVEAVLSRRSSRTRVLSLSHITSPTALLFPVEELVRRAREAGILTVIDGAHAPGQVPLNLEALGADFYAGNCHKWLLSPKGAGFLHARREVQGFLRPLVVSWGGERPRGPGPSPFLDELEWTGTRDISAYLAVPAAIRFLEEHDWESVRARCRELLAEFSRAVVGLGLQPVGEGPEPWPLQMRSFLLPAVDGRALQRELFERWRIEVPVIPWNGRSLLRVSVQGTTPPATSTASSQPWRTTYSPVSADRLAVSLCPAGQVSNELLDNPSQFGQAIQPDLGRPIPFGVDPTQIQRPEPVCSDERDRLPTGARRTEREVV